MRKIKEVLRLHSLGLKQRQIARSCSIGQSTVSEYLKAAEAAGIVWSEVAGWDESRLAAALIPKAPAQPKADRRPTPDFTAIRTELQRHKHLTLQLLWEEYRANHSDGYGYSRFCELYQRWLRNLAIALGNAPGTDKVVAALRSRAEDSSALVREHVHWALEQHL